MVEQLQESSFISDLPSVPFNNLDELPAIPAIYFALDDTKIVWYVGRAKNLKKLFYSRHKREKEFRENNVCNIAYLQVEEKKLLTEEAKFKTCFDPSLNKNISSLFVPAIKKVYDRLQKQGLNHANITQKTGIRRHFYREMSNKNVNIFNLEKFLLSDCVDEKMFEKYFIEEMKRLWKLHKESSDAEQQHTKENDSDVKGDILDKNKKKQINTRYLNHDNSQQIEEKEYQPQKRVKELAGIKERSKPDTFCSLEDFQDTRKKTNKLIVYRKGQFKFRSELLAAYQGRCAITGFNAEKALEAAHIFPYKGDNTNKVCNGLLLRADIHKLFDSYLITVHPVTKKIAIAPELKNTNYSEIEGQKLRLPKDVNLCPRQDLLEQHYKRCQWV